MLEISLPAGLLQSSAQFGSVLLELLAHFALVPQLCLPMLL